MNGNRKPSNGGYSDSAANVYQNPYPINPNVNGTSWSPQSPVFPPFPPSNGWPQQPQQQQSQPPTPISTNGMAVGPPLQVQQTPQFTNNLASMLPANILQEVFRMSVPVGNSPNDDDILVKALKESTEKGKTYKQAIETLHGVNNHAANLWKDYYLDHKHRIDKLVSPPPDLPVKTVKKPSPYRPPQPQPPSTRSADAKTSESNRAASGSRVPPPPRRGVAVKKEPGSPPPISSSNKQPAKPNPAGKRRTINSITAHEPALNLKLLPLQRDIVLPDPPSRPPTPPTKVVRGANGNRYTPEDKQFFIKFIHWELEQDPDLTKDQLCTMLAEKVPSHTAASWKSHWSNAHELADKIYSHYDPRSDDEHRPTGNDSTALKKRRPNYTEISDDSEIESKAESSSASSLSSENESDSNELDELLAADSDDVGQPGGSYTNTDMRNLVVHIASLPDEDSISWGEYSEKYPARTDKSWREYYRRNEKDIRKHLRQYRKRDGTKKSTTSVSQRGRPSWAQSSSSQMGSIPSALKRKVSSAGGYDGKFKRVKDSSVDLDSD